MYIVAQLEPNSTMIVVEKCSNIGSVGRIAKIKASEQAIINEQCATMMAMKASIGNYFSSCTPKRKK